MGKVHIPENVLFICAVCFSPASPVEDAIEDMIHQFGPIADQTPITEFQYTAYYQQEMGAPLLKLFYTFQNTIPPQDLVEAKLYTNQLEERYAAAGKRQINLDPGYIELPKLVLATTKNFSHRIYLNRGIYGDVQLAWRGGAFQVNPWTYPDYKSTRVLKFFNAARQSYFESLKQGKQT